MSTTLVQRLRGQGIAIHLHGDLKTIDFFGPKSAAGQQRMLAVYAGEILNELRAEHELGRKWARVMFEYFGPIKVCQHVWSLVDGPGLQPIACSKCGAPA